MFVDQVKVFVKGGDGGNGMVAFRREKYVPDGGPAGGDGGKGADVIFVVNEGLRTLMDFRYKRHFKGAKGENGRTKNQHGKSADPMIIPVPPGTVVRDLATNEVIADLTDNGQRAVIAAGGRGGRGNTRFSTPANPAPYISENGEPGQEREIQLELKLLADAGLVGFPSVGKSTLLAAVTAARPKIAAYHFTTLSPNLGVVSVDEGSSFVIADLPGLIEGASQGAGLGYQFLRHIERTRVIVHVVDMSGSEGRDPFMDYQKINEELKSYQYRLMERPQIIAASKMDMPGASEQLAAFRKKIGNEVPIFPISSVTHEGLPPLIRKIYETIEHTPTFPLAELAIEKDAVFQLSDEDAPFIISRGS
ncbi:MAG: GTPase ObgE, partial [Sporolactobacillus sp.]